MKGLFMVFHGMSAHSGISKKIAYQCEALDRCGVETTLCHLDVTAEGARRRMAGDREIGHFGGGMRGRLIHRFSFKDVTDYIRKEQIGFIYIRYDHNANPFTIAWLRTLRRMGIRIALEIPTYPYDPEYRGQGISMHVKLQIDRLFRHSLMRYTDRIVTFSDDAQIFGRPTIRISNGINFNSIPLKTHYREHPDELHLLGVANIHLWHAFDRVIAGLAEYYHTPRNYKVHFTIVGDGDTRLIEAYRNLISLNNLEPYIRIAGPLSGSALDEVFEWADMGIASLGRHRTGIDKLRSLKNREYAARGIPFIYSESDDDFDRMPYVMKAPADDSPIQIEELVRFRSSLGIAPQQIRASIEGSLSWERQMETVIREMNLL